MLFRIRPELFYQQVPVIFVCDSYHLGRFLARPGGLVEYVSAFLSPLFAVGWLGALVVTVLATGICLATRQFLTAIARTGGYVLFLIPALLIGMGMERYCHPVSLCTGLLVILLFVNVYVSFRGNSTTFRFTIFVILSGLAYHLAAGLYVVFAILCGIAEFRDLRSRFLGVACLVCACLVPASGMWLFDLSFTDAFRGLLPPSQAYWLAILRPAGIATATRVGLLLSFPAIAIVAVVMRRRCSRGVYGSTPQTELSTEVLSEPLLVSHSSMSPGQLAARSMLFVGLGWAADAALFDSSTQCVLQMAYSDERREWSRVLENAQHLPLTDSYWEEITTTYYVNRALYFTGSLLEQMFVHIQVLDAPALALGLETSAGPMQAAPMECSDVLFDLGRINESEHMAYESLQIYGERPSLLKRLVYISVLKGEPAAARILLNRLEWSLTHREWARSCRRQLDNDPLLSSVPEVASRRELMVVHDSIGQLDLETMLLQLLKRNPQNRMAFEYLMAHYLLTRQLDKLATQLHRLDDFDVPNEWWTRSVQ